MSNDVKTNKLFLKLKTLEDANPKITLNIQNELYNVVKKILARIPQYMPEYTAHDIDHCINILDIIGKILPEKIELNIVELQILIYAVFLHDIGMVVNKDEAEKLQKSEEFSKITREFDNETSDDEILTELIRRTHVQRSLEYVDKFKNDFTEYKIDFSFNAIDIDEYVKNVIESHELPVSALTNKIKYPTETQIDSYTANIQFLALLLRLGDILDFDITRAPHFLYKHIGLKNKISQEEWQKHQAITGRTYFPLEVKFVAKPKSIQIHRKIEEFMEWIERERKESIELLASNLNREKYNLELTKEIKIDIQPQGYEYTKLEINLDYEKVLNILMGTELYDNVDVFLRELLQNSYDACKYYQELYNKTKDDLDSDYKPKIIIKYDSKENILEIIDNGIGIDEDTFRDYVITIGKSYYKSKYFEIENTQFKPISNFGIGILSCFMVSDTIEIESYKKDSNPIHYVMNIGDKYISKLTTSKNKNGTRIKLKLHDDFFEKLENKSIKDIINANISYQPIPISLRENEKEEVTFCKQSIEVPQQYQLIDGFITITFDETDELEGYIVIHKQQGQHQYLEESKLSQQNFVITNKKNPIPLQPLWLQNIKYNINIPDSRKLHLKASRNSVYEDANLLIIREKIAQKIIDYFKQNEHKYQNNFIHMIEYLGDGRGNLLRFQSEYDFLINIKMFQVFTIQTLDNGQVNMQSKYLSFQDFVDELESNKQIKIAVVKDAYFQNQTNLSILMPYFNANYEYIVIDNFYSINYFYQFIEPICEKIEVYTADIGGLTYQSFIVNKKENLSIDSYKKDYSWTNINKNIDEKYFAVISNNHYNGLDITLINGAHKLGKLMEEHKDKFYVKGFKNSIINNFSKKYIHNKQLDIFIWEEIENHFFFNTNNLEAYAAKFQRCFLDTFLDSLNCVLDEKMLTKLVSENLIKEEEKTNYFLTKSDFPQWYFKV
ncbi:MAG: ATP-binding protein [Campylobacterales bacterium]|nr:ATP-binding protein [Campylobacterales bacterium]